MPEAKLMDLLAELFDSQRSAVLATQGGGQPYCSLMAFAATGDLRDLLFATLRATRKYAHLAADSRAAMLVDNRTNQPSDTETALAVTATGRAAEVGAPEKDRLLGIYLAKHPHLQGFLALPDCALMRLRVDQYYVVSHFQEVQVWSMTP